MTNAVPTEIELKLALPSAQVARFLHRMARRRHPPTRQSLVTRYYDTPGFDLAGLGIALRLRRAGQRWVQTLKTGGVRGGGLSRREEYETPTARGALDWAGFPPAAQARVPDALRPALGVAFETRFERTAWLIEGRGGALIEVALDVGEVRAGKRREPICEIELELKKGNPDALFVLAEDWAARLDCLPLDISKAERGVRLAHGNAEAPMKATPIELAPGGDVAAGFAVICQACLGQFQANLPGVLADDDIEYVHQARVALRRLRAALRLFRGAVALPDALAGSLRALAAALGPARDWDVLCRETLPAMAPHYPDPAAWQQGMAVFEARRIEVRAAMREALRAARPGAWLLAFQRWLLQRGWRAAPPARRLRQMSPLEDHARLALDQSHRRIVRGARKFERLDASRRHALRILVKRQRYVVEFFRPLFAGCRHTAYPAVLSELQDALGRSNDLQVAWSLLATRAQDAGAMGAFALGWLAARRTQPDSDAAVAPLRHFMKCRPCW